MKKSLAISILLLSLNSFSQNLGCCKSIEDVKKAIEGNWTLEGKSENIIYKFWFDKDKGFIEALEELNLPPKAEQTQLGSLVVNEKTLINIKLIKDNFFIELVYPFAVVSEQIFELNEEKFVYGKAESEHVFVKDEN